VRCLKSEGPGFAEGPETSSLRMFPNFSLRVVRAIAGKDRSAEYRPRAYGGLAEVVKGAQCRKVPRSGYKIFTNHLRTGRRLDMISRLRRSLGLKLKVK